MHMCLPAETQSALSRSQKLVAQIAGHSRSAAAALLAPYFALCLASAHLSLPAPHALLATGSLLQHHLISCIWHFICPFCILRQLSAVWLIRIVLECHFGVSQSVF